MKYFPPKNHWTEPLWLKPTKMANYTNNSFLFWKLIIHCLIRSYWERYFFICWCGFNNGSKLTVLFSLHWLWLQFLCILWELFLAAVGALFRLERIEDVSGICSLSELKEFNCKPSNYCQKWGTLCGTGESVLPLRKTQWKGSIHMELILYVSASMGLLKDFFASCFSLWCFSF